MKQRTGSKLGKEYNKAVYCHLAYLTYINYKNIMGNAGLDESPTGINTAWRNISNLRYTDDTIHMADSEEELKEPLDESERGE